MLTKSKIFLLCCVSLILSIGLSSYLPINWLSLDILWFCLLIISIVFLLVSANKRIGIIALIGLFFFLGIWRYSLSLPEDQDDKIWHYQGQEVVFTGKIISEPEERPKSSQIKLRAKELDNKPIHGQVLIITEHYPKYEYGDLLEVNCKLQSPEPFNDFDYDRYLARSNIYVLCYYPEIKIISHDPNLYNYLISFKQGIRDIINLGLLEPEASLGNAIILGYKKGLPDDLRLTFSQVGLSHITAISGMHIGILAVLVLNLLLLLGMNRKRVIYYSTIILGLYIIMIGAPVSALRAGLMGFLALLAMQAGRLKHATNALFLAGVIILLINPRVLRDDVGFQLSFLAVLGIMIIYPRLKRLVMKKIKTKNRVANTIVDIFLITISAQIFTIPIVAYNFKIISLVSPFANVLVIWLLPVLLITMIIAVILSWLITSWSAFLFLPSLLILKYIINLSELLSKIPMSFITW
ncbi:MAG: ComEC/Rec2 family competence protein [bacterium]